MLSEIFLFFSILKESYASVNVYTYDNCIYVHSNFLDTYKDLHNKSNNVRISEYFVSEEPGILVCGIIHEGYAPSDYPLPIVQSPIKNYDEETGRLN